MRVWPAIIFAICLGGCAAPRTEVRQVNPQDWGPGYSPGIEFGPAEAHLSRAFGLAEAFLARQPFAGKYARRACSGGGDRFVEVRFSLLSDSSGRTRGTVRVDTVSGECVWLANKQ